METGQSEHVFRFRPLRLSYDLEGHDRELSLMLRDSLQWRYDPRRALEVHFAREMYHCVRRQERLKIVEERCADRALTCPDEEARSVAEQARIWSRCRTRAKREYFQAKTELKALIDEREQLDGAEAWPGLVRERRERVRAARAAAKARMKEPGHDPASDPNPGNAVFVPPPRAWPFSKASILPRAAVPPPSGCSQKPTRPRRKAARTNPRSTKVARTLAHRAEPNSVA